MADVQIDLDALQAEVNSMSQEDLVKQLLDLRTRQKVNQKKYHNPERAKAYHAKRNATMKALVEKAKQLGLYDGIVAQANKKADEIIESEAASAAAVDGESDD